jgi:hypothetical protein
MDGNDGEGTARESETGVGTATAAVSLWFRAVLQFTWSLENCERWLFLEEKATQQSCFPSTATGEPL